MTVEQSDTDAYVYEYRGRGASSDIVASVKKHHAVEHGTNYSDLMARKIGEGGQKVRITQVVVVE